MNLVSFDEKATVISSGVLYKGSVYPLQGSPIAVIEGFLIGFGIMAYIKGPDGNLKDHRFTKKDY